ncbi:MAG: helix-turn-helix transcriptional regulator [Planctomycetia bacterium]
MPVIRSASPADVALLRELGARLRLQRESAGLSQEALAHACGLHRTYIGSVERGERNATYLSLHKYASALGLTVAQLVSP